MRTCMRWSLALLLACGPSAGFELPAFSWATVPRFVHCGPTLAKYPTPEAQQLLYRQLSAFPMVTLEKFTWEQLPPAGQHQRQKILRAAAGIRRFNTSTKVMYYQMAWQDFPQYELHNLSQAHAREGWLVSWDNGTIPGLDMHGTAIYNLSHPEMRRAWVSELQAALGTGLVDGFFIDITPQVLPDSTDRSDPHDGTVRYAQNVAQICRYCSDSRRASLLQGLELAMTELAAACPAAVIICNPTDTVRGCNTQFFEYFGSSADHGRSVLGDFQILQDKFGGPQGSGHLVQARAAGFNHSTLLHLAEFLVAAGMSHSPGWGCSDGWLDHGAPGDPELWSRPLGEPDGAFTSEPNGAPVAPGTSTPGRVYTRSFGGNATRVWLNLTDGNLWKHARACTKKPWPANPVCPQVCIWWADGAVSSWPDGFKCTTSVLTNNSTSSSRERLSERLGHA